MILAIDTGNTHTVLGCMDDHGKACQILRIETNRNKTDYEYAVEIKQILELAGVDPRSFSGAIISSVVPSVTPLLHQAVRLISGLDALVVGAGVKSGLHLAIGDPGSLAPDLVATAVAAKENYQLPCIIIDMGTATTITVVDRDGKYIGGAILPGVGLSMNALASGTSLLPNIDILPPSKLIATETVDAMKAGILYGSAGAIDGILERYLKELGEGGSIVATGGLSPLICPYCSHKIVIDDQLLLSGLYIIWKKTTASRKK